MTTYLVTRHEGTRIWAKAMAKHGRLPFAIDQMIEHLDPALLKKGDVVVGTLPLQLVAQLQSEGIDFWSLDLDVPPAKRGQELNPIEVFTYRARLSRYDVRRKEETDIEPSRESRAIPTALGVTVAVVTDELVPLAIGWRHAPTPFVVLLVTALKKNRAGIYEHWLKAQPEPTKVLSVDWDDRNFDSITSAADSVANDLLEHGHTEVVVNLNGGTKPMAIALQRAFLQRSTAFGTTLRGPYVDTQQHCIEDLLAPQRGRTPMRSVLNIADLLGLQGFTLESAESSLHRPHAFTEREDLFSILMGKKAHAWRSLWYVLLGAANDLVEDLFEKGASKSQSVKYRAGNVANVRVEREEEALTVHIDFSEPFRGDAVKDLMAAIKGAFGKALNAIPGTRVAFEDPAHLRLRFQSRGKAELAFHTGTWMEFWLAKRLARSGVDDWVQGLQVKQGSVRNEFDIVAACGNRLLVVEVKTANLQAGGRDQSKGSDTLYKLDALADKLGGRYFNARWLISLKPLNGVDADRATRHKIRVISGQDLQQINALIEEWVQDAQLERDPRFAPTSIGVKSE